MPGPGGHGGGPGGHGGHGGGPGFGSPGGHGGGPGFGGPGGFIGVFAAHHGGPLGFQGRSSTGHTDDPSSTSPSSDNDGYNFYEPGVPGAVRKKTRRRRRK